MFNYKLVESKSKKYKIKLKIDGHGEIIVYALKGIKKSEIEKFLLSNNDWICKNLQNINKLNIEKGTLTYQQIVNYKNSA